MLNKLIRTDPKVDSVFIKPVSAEAILLDAGLFDTNGDRTFINAATGQTTDLGDAHPFEQLRRTGDPLADASSPDRVVVYGEDGRQRCTVPGSAQLPCTVSHSPEWRGWDTSSST